MGRRENQTTATAPAGVLPGAASLSADAELILDAIGAGVLAIDADGRTTLANDTACRALGVNAIDLIGRTLHDLIHHSRPDGSVYPAEECPLNATLRDGLVRHNESDVFWRPDGTAVPVEYDPPVSDPKEFRLTEWTPPPGSPGPNRPFRIQAEPARQLKNLRGIPILWLQGENNYSGPAQVQFLRQAGCDAEFMRLRDRGLEDGNTNLMLLERNNFEVFGLIRDWLQQRVRA